MPRLTVVGLAAAASCCLLLCAIESTAHRQWPGRHQATVSSSSADEAEVASLPYALLPARGAEDVSGTSFTFSPREVMERHMRRCVELARQGAVPFGALIADPATGKVVAEGANNPEYDPTGRFSGPMWHGEMVAIANATEILGAEEFQRRARSLELYTSAEPCPMCASTAVWAGLGAVIFGSSIQTLVRDGYPQIEIAMEEVVSRLSPHFTPTGSKAGRAPFRMALVPGFLKEETDPLYTHTAPVAMPIVNAGNTASLPN